VEGLVNGCWVGGEGGLSVGWMGGKGGKVKGVAVIEFPLSPKPKLERFNAGKRWWGRRERG
jgi:hypothetical protein